MESLIQSYTGGWGVQVVHAPLEPACKEWAQKIEEIVRTHPQGAAFSKLRVFGFFTKVGNQQDVSSAVAPGAADSAAAAQVAAYASGRLKGFCAPVPGICWLVGGGGGQTANSKRAYCASSGQKPNDPVALHVVSAPSPLTVTFLAATEAVDGAQEEWHQKMDGTNPIWWTQKGLCGQIIFSVAANEMFLKREQEKVTLSLQEGDTLLVAPATPLWFESEQMAILHSTTFFRVPQDEPNMESAASEWFRFYRSPGGLCDPGPHYRSGAIFITADNLPRFVKPAFPLDTSMVFDVDVAALQTAKPTKITSTELELLFWIGFVHKLIAAFKLLEPGMWSAEFETKHREHLTDWLQFFQAPEGKIKRIIKTSTVRSALSTLCDTLEKLASRSLFFKEWVPRFESAAPILAAINFSNNNIELKNQHRETLRVFRDLQKVANWPKVFQQGKDSLIQAAVEQAEQLIKADPNRWPQNPRAWLDKKREGLNEFRGDPKIPQEKVDQFETMLNLTDEDAATSVFLSIDREFHDLMRLFDPSYDATYVAPYPVAVATKTSKPKKRSRSPSLVADDDEEGESVGNSEDDNEEENELPLGTIARDIMARQWKATVLTVKTECCVCQKTTIPLAFSYCVDCCNEDLNALIHQSLRAGLAVMVKNGDSSHAEEFAKRVKALKKKDEDNEHIFDSGVSRATQVKVFKELLDEFAALEHDFATQGVVLAEHEDSQDLEEYGDESPMSEDHENDDDEEEDEEEEEEEEESSSSSGVSSDRRVSKKTRSEGPEMLALDLLRLRTERGLFVTKQEEMEGLCLAGDEKSVVAARVFLDKLKSLPSQWCVDMTDLESKSTQMCDSLGWFETEREAVKAKIIHEAMHSHLKGQVAFSVREKKNSPQ
jgi:hypothetical protein